MDSSNRRRILAGTCTAILAATLFFNTVDTFLRGSGPATPGEIAAAGFLAVLHVGLTIAAVFGITQLVRRKADRLGLAGAAFTLLGATVGARIMVLVQLASLAEPVPGAPATLSGLLQSAPIVWVSIIPIGLMYPLGLILLGSALAIARPVNRWIGVLLVIAGILFPIGRALNVDPAVYASDVVLAITYGFLSWEILTRRELWDDTLVMAQDERREGEYEAFAQPAQ
jgi:hypothetical protein